MRIHPRSTMIAAAVAVAQLGLAAAGSPTPVATPPTATAPDAVVTTSTSTSAPPPRPTSLAATVTEIDLARRTAVVTGTSEPDATIVVDDSFEVEATADGTWQAPLSSLDLGPATVHLAEFRGESRIDAFELSFFVGTPLDVTGSFPPQRAERARIAGTATPGSVVEAVDRQGGPLGSGATSTEGVVDFPVLAPDAGGVHTVTLRQTLGGETVDTDALDLDYGAAVAVVSPVDGSPHGGGPVTLSGTGIPRGEVRVREKGSTSWLAPAVAVLASGSWHLTTSALDDTGHELEVVQIGRGLNRTTDVVALATTAPAPSPLRPGVVTGPSTYSSGAATRIQGTATPRASVTLTNAWGTELAKGIPVSADGTWQHDRVLVAPSVYTLWVGQSLDGQATEDGPFTISPDPVRPEFRVTSPERDAGYVSTAMTTFRGTADPRADVHVQNKWGTRITGPVDVSATGDWSLTYMLVAPSVYDLTFVETTPGAAPRTVHYGAFRPRS